MDLYQQFISLSQIIIIDLILAGDNAVVVGLAASRVAPRLRAKVIFWGVAGAVALRVQFALVATQLLAIVGLTLAGGILLLWVCWKMYREIAFVPAQPAFAGPGHHGANAPVQTVSFYAALGQIIVADVSMSLDNVLAVAGAAKGDIGLLIVGLTVAVAFMALASAYIARLLTRYHWITWVGLSVIVYVALEMVWSGTQQVTCRLGSRAACEHGLLSALTSLFT